MATMTGTRKRLAAYAHTETGNEAEGCYSLEQRLAWGIGIFRRLVEEEGRIQRDAVGKPTPSLEAFFEFTPLVYAAWVKASEAHLARAEELQRAGYVVDGVEEFRLTLDEARTLVELLDCENEIPPIDQILKTLESRTQTLDASGK